MKRPSISIHYDGRNLPEGRHSVRWSVYHSGKQKTYTTGIVLDESDVVFLKANKDSLSGRIKDDEKRNLWSKIYGETYIDYLSGERKESILAQGKRILATIESYFTFEIFGQAITGNLKVESKAPTESDLIKALEDRGALLKSQGDGSNGALHESAAASLRRYAVYAKLARSKSSAILPLMVITPTFLKNYERWMLKYGKAPKKENSPETPASISTASIYCRYIRKIWNDAIDSKIVSAENYPFKTAHKTGFKIASVLNEKKAIPEDVLAQLFAYEAAPESSRQKWLDMWLFIYMGNGINTMDLCKLENNDLNMEEMTITFFRDKTIDTKRSNMKKIIISILPEMIPIIDKWRNTDRSPHSRLFPYLPKDATPEREKLLVNQVTRNINDHLKRIAKELGLDMKIKTYQARHTFATMLATTNAPLKYISEKYGHGSMKTTELYIGSIKGKATESYLSNIVPKRKQEPATEKGKDPAD
jgi:integrase